MYPEIPIHRFLVDTVGNHPDYLACSFNEIQMTYQGLNLKVNLFAQALGRMGIAKGDRVAFLLINSPAYIIAFFAVLKLGAIVVNLNVGIQGDGLGRCLQESGAKAVVSLDLFAQNIYQAIKNTGVETVILHSVFGLEKNLSLAEGAPQPQLFQEVMASSQNPAEPELRILPEDVAVLQYTSGSTGAPKSRHLDPCQYCGQCDSVQYLDKYTGRRKCRSDVCYSFFSCLWDVGLSPGLRT